MTLASGGLIHEVLTSDGLVVRCTSCSWSYLVIHPMELRRMFPALPIDDESHRAFWQGVATMHIALRHPVEFEAMVGIRAELRLAEYRARLGPMYNEARRLAA